MPSPTGVTSQTTDWLRLSLSATSVALTVAALLTIIVGWIGLAVINQRSRSELEAQLNAEVDTSVFAVQLWLDDQRDVAQSWASEAGVQSEIASYVSLPWVRAWDRERAMASSELQHLRTRLGGVCQAHGYVGFMVLDPQGLQIAALLDDAVGKRLNAAAQETLFHTFQGEVLVTRPYISSIPLPDETGILRDHSPTMLVAAPVKDLEGIVVAVLAFRLRPEKQFAQALESGRPGESGETYAFDKQGLLLSDSRFNDDLRQIGLIAQDPSSRAVLSMEVRDPGGNMLRGFRPSLPRQTLPLTRMAASAVEGQNGVNSSGYRDYRGVPVVGAWRWLPTYEFGVAHEIDMAEAYAPLYAIQKVFLGWLGLFAAALLTSIVLQFRRLRAERLRSQTQEELAALSNRYQVVLDSATQISIIATDMSGVITVFNAGAERMLQYRAEDVIGRMTPAAIHLDSEVRDHGEQLSREFGRSIQGFDVFVEYARQGKFEEREWTYIRKDGSQLTVNLVVTALKDSSGQLAGFLGVAMDMTERKQAELALGHERFLLHTLMDNLPDSIYFKDDKSCFLRINRAMAQRFGISNPQAAVGKTDFDFFAADHAKQVQADDQIVMTTAEPIISKEERETWPDGRRVWVSTSKLPLRDEEGEIAGTFGISRDISERKLADERFRLVVEASQNALLVVDRLGKIVLVNSQTERLFGYAREELLGKSIEVLVPPHIRGTHPKLRDGYFARPQVRAMGEGGELFGTRKDGTTVPVEIGLSPLETEGGVFALASIVDITARKAIEDSLRSAKESAEAASRAKTDFLANMSHEIRTPMNAIIGMTELVLGTELPAVQREYLTIVLESSESLLTIINEVLDFSKIEAGKMELENVDFSLWDTVGDAMKSLALRAHSRGLELAYHIGSEIPENLDGDPIRLRQVLMNLVGNSVKFTERGEILVDISCIDQKEVGVLLRVAVTDTGIGIPQEKQKQIFDAFTQADSSTTRRFGGTGLGLAITSRIVSLMGGELQLESQPGVGSTFSFSVWFGRGQPRSTPGTRFATDLVKNVEVMIVDDNATNRRILEEMVRSWKMKPLMEPSAASAIKHLQLRASAGNPIPLLLTDVHMPDMDGLAMVEVLRKNSSYTNLPVIVLSSGDRGTESNRCERLGVAAHLMKPVKQSELLTAIEDSLSAGGRTAPLQPIKAGDATPQIAPLRILLAEDGLTNQKLAVALLTRWGHQVEVAANGQEAVHAYERENFDLILMDVQMPEMDGLEATACIRSLEKKTRRHIPIVAMTARAMKGDREHCLEAGMDGYVAKPIRQKELYQAIATYFPTLTNSSTRPTGIDWNHALKAVEGDRQVQGELVATFLQEGPQLLKDMEQGIQTGDAPVVGRTAHTLKSNLKLFGAAPAAEIAKQIECLGGQAQWEGMELLLADLRVQMRQIIAELESFQASPTESLGIKMSKEPRD